MKKPCLLIKAIDTKTGYTLVGNVGKVLNELDADTEHVRGIIEAYGSTNLKGVVILPVKDMYDMRELLGRSVRMQLADGDEIQFLTKRGGVMYDDDGQQILDLEGYDEEWMIRHITDADIVGFYPMGGRKE